MESVDDPLSWEEAKRTATPHFTDELLIQAKRNIALGRGNVEKLQALRASAQKFAIPVWHGSIDRVSVIDELLEQASRCGVVDDVGEETVIKTIETGLANFKSKEACERPQACAPPGWEVSCANDRLANGKQWPVMDEAAYLGLAGDIVRTIEPHSESDPVALLIQTLVSFGSVVGPIPYYQVEADRHHANLFVLIVGNSSKARKGTSAGRVLSFFKPVDPAWADARMKSGLSSGEGLINEVRDPVKEWDAKANTEITIDQGVNDKRLLVTEAEFASALSVMERHGNTLSPILRKAWDGSKLSTMTRSSPLTATDSHVSIIGHITEAELKARLTKTEMANGLANRFLIPLVRRSKLLPHGGHMLEPSAVADLSARINDAVSYATTMVDRVLMAPDAAAMWEGIYAGLSADRPGMLGAITARAEAQTVRLAMIYALLDHCDHIEEAHLRAAVAIWQYCEASALRIFGDALGDPVADQILEALRSAGQRGMTRTQISGLFGRNQSGERIGAALALLQGRGLALPEPRPGASGRPAEVWIARKGQRLRSVDGRL